MSEIPKDLRYSSSHEWVRVDGDEATIGITDHAQDALNDIVYVELPESGALFEAEDEFGVVESVKSVSELYIPLAGKVVAVNDALIDAPETINDDPYGAGWLVKIKMTDPDAADGLLTADAYRKEIDA